MLEKVSILASLVRPESATDGAPPINGSGHISDGLNLGTARKADVPAIVRWCAFRALMLLIVSQKLILRQSSRIKSKSSLQERLWYKLPEGNCGCQTLFIIIIVFFLTRLHVCGRIKMGHSVFQHRVSFFLSGVGLYFQLHPLLFFPLHHPPNPPLHVWAKSNPPCNYVAMDMEASTIQWRSMQYKWNSQLCSHKFT